MRIRLTRKLAEFIDGVDLRGFQVGDVVDLAAADAKLLIAEGWAAESTPAESTFLTRSSPGRDRAETRETHTERKLAATPDFRNPDVPGRASADDRQHRGVPG